MDTEAFLSEEVLSGIPERAWLDGPAELVIGNQRLEEVSLSNAATVYEIADDHLGLVVEAAGLRLLASVDRDALRPVLVVPTLAVPELSWSADGIGLRFPAGTPGRCRDSDRRLGADGIQRALAGGQRLGAAGGGRGLCNQG